MVSNLAPEVTPFTPKFLALYLGGTVCLCPRPSFQAVSHSTSVSGKSCRYRRVRKSPRSHVSCPPCNTHLLTGLNVQNRVIIWSYRWHIVLLLGLLVIGEVILIGIGGILSVLPPTSILIWYVGLRNRGVTTAWSDELQLCVGFQGSQKSDIGLFSPYGRVTSNIGSSSSPDLCFFSSSGGLRDPHPNGYWSSQAQVHIKLRGCALPPRSQFFSSGSFLPNICHRESKLMYSEHLPWLNLLVT